MWYSISENISLTSHGNMRITGIFKLCVWHIQKIIKVRMNDWPSEFRSKLFEYFFLHVYFAPGNVFLEYIRLTAPCGGILTGMVFHNHLHANNGCTENQLIAFTYVTVVGLVGMFLTVMGNIFQTREMYPAYLLTIKGQKSSTPHSFGFAVLSDACLVIYGILNADIVLIIYGLFNSSVIYATMFCIRRDDTTKCLDPTLAPNIPKQQNKTCICEQ